MWGINSGVGGLHMISTVYDTVDMYPMHGNPIGAGGESLWQILNLKRTEQTFTHVRYYSHQTVNSGRLMQYTQQQILNIYSTHQIHCTLHLILVTQCTQN